MFEKSYITDCEGPLTLNDNAYEIADYFIHEGGKLFSILSLYDDYLVDEEKREGYKAGNTLKLIIPFFLLENISDKDMVEFSQKNIFSIPDSRFLLDYLKDQMNVYIVSTSYGQYIEALSNFMEFPFENTFYTKANVDTMELKDIEIEKLTEFKSLILENPKDYKLFDKIFFEEIPEMGFYNKLKNVEVIGGEGKKIAIEEIIDKNGINQNQILYIGDSITDVEPLRFAFENNGVSISFNGNRYSLQAAEIAIISPSSVASLVVADIFNKNSKEKVIKFINEYNSSNNIIDLFERYKVDLKIINKFSDVFNNKDYPIIKVINKENFNEILDESIKMRKIVRGEKIANLG